MVGEGGQEGARLALAWGDGGQGGTSSLTLISALDEWLAGHCHGNHMARPYGCCGGGVTPVQGLCRRQFLPPPPTSCPQVSPKGLAAGLSTSAGNIKSLKQISLSSTSARPPTAGQGCQQGGQHWEMAGKLLPSG